jgi:hypothetical protein
MERILPRLAALQLFSEKVDSWFRPTLRTDKIASNAATQLGWRDRSQKFLRNRGDPGLRQGGRANISSSIVNGDLRPRDVPQLGDD